MSVGHPLFTRDQNTAAARLPPLPRGKKEGGLRSRLGLAWDWFLDIVVDGVDYDKLSTAVRPVGVYC